ncbi:hotdog family protein [Burkholderia territorii]|uniref:3-hydroxylacyl-ACP dehydratase n=1 Tax=Burkholderia territorii TaxID=1503055 RepID=A0A107HU69_9BURK|nr:hotdog family protein [Burkholderia territorii]AOI66620.1 3-hydroxylacyl-ACP dehydratase [Burkholderia territorii]KVN46561.1 3-hydroxylacyl-ACP dehydratase [Burkholderia territorii]KVQ58836.1 3-hydroxylacyl-ACP dehydratase [Burkholderia territorii]KWA02285.1 3-hydroxylacyl-ACP dehydratase [Burkholderia territorii]KWA33289.1 3-hydroxylacyl-ACP dehydratase [Burkholderia territorii]
MTTPVSTLVPEPTAATLDRAWIAAHIPHDGAMCLLDRVEAWDAARIRCSATSHRDPRNPLRSHGRLASVCGIEYAAQAMAVHGALLSTQCAQTEFARPRAGYLASVRNVDAFVDRLDTFELPLIVDAERIGGDDRSVLYGFTLRCGERVLLGGRAVVMLDASAAGVLVPPPAGRADIR